MKIVLAGYGIEGRASLTYWNTAGNQVMVADEKGVPQGLPAGVPTITGIDAFSKLGDADLIIRSPSVHPDKLPYGDKVWSATNEFFASCPAPIIGVTGTKGKGTTSSLITSILKAAGKTVHLIGNIGTPALSELSNIEPTDIVVFELSSFQLWDIKRSPHIAVVLGIEPDHLDVHKDLGEYIAAKAGITKHQSANDILVFNSNNSTSVSIAATSNAQKKPYPIDMSDYADALIIPGQHNVDNAAAAITAVGEYLTDVAIIRRGLANFTGLPHRIKFIRELNDVKFYDDSYSSAPSASLAALKSFDRPKVILLGGFEKNADFSELASYVATSSTIRAAVIYGATRQRIANTLLTAGVDPNKLYVHNSQEFRDIVHDAVNLTSPGDVLLLSPGCASFDMFENFTKRGEQFQEIVESL